jgi:hypothetical protein
LSGCHTAVKLFQWQAVRKPGIAAPERFRSHTCYLDDEKTRVQKYSWLFNQRVVYTSQTNPFFWQCVFLLPRERNTFKNKKYYLGPKAIFYIILRYFK